MIVSKDVDGGMSQGSWRHWDIPREKEAKGEMEDLERLLAWIDLNGRPTKNVVCRAPNENMRENLRENRRENLCENLRENPVSRLCFAANALLVEKTLLGWTKLLQN
jgi:hypothetical protein